MFVRFKKKQEIPKLKKVTEADLHKEKLQAVLTEYSCLRAEAQHDDTHQIQLVTVTFTALAALISAVATFGVDLLNGLSREICMFLFFVVLPFLVMFMGLLWIDLIYRRTRFGAYTMMLENKINCLLMVNKAEAEKPVAWEHWIQSLDNDRTFSTLTEFFNVTSFFRGYVVTGSWLAAPGLIIWTYFLFSKCTFFEEIKATLEVCRIYWLVSLVVLLIYSIYYFLFYKYLKKILSLIKDIP